MKKLFIKLVVLSIVLMSIMMWTVPAKAQTTHLYLDSVATWSVNHFCYHMVSGAYLHKPALDTLQYWVYGGDAYYGDSILIPNTFNGQITCYFRGGSKSITVKFDVPVQDPDLLDSVFCGETPFTLNAGNVGSSYLWSTGETTQTISVHTSSLYIVTVYNACNSISDSATLVFKLPHPDICAVTYNPTLGYNQMLWDGSDTTARKAYILKRQTNNQMQVIDSVLFSSGNWVDNSSTPNDMAEYSLQASYCGGMSDTSTHHITMWTTITEYGSQVTFNVTPYKGLSISTITLYGITSLQIVDSIKSIATSLPNTSISATQAGNYTQFFFGFDVDCGGAKSTRHVESNRVDGLTGIINFGKTEKISLYPSPTSGRFTVAVDNNDFTVDVYTANGIKIFSQNFQDIDISQFPAGIYYVKVIINTSVYTGKVIKF